MDKKREFQKRILATFKVEAEENISSLSLLLIELEKAPALIGNEELFEKLYRSAHSLKGAARAVSIGDIESLCHAFEDVLSAIRNQEIGVSTNTIDVFFVTVDLIGELLQALENGIPDELSVAVSTHVDLLALLEVGETVELPKKVIPKKEWPIVSEKTEQTKNPIQETNIQAREEQKVERSKPKIQEAKKVVSKKNDTVRISTKKLDNFLTQVEELLPLKLSAIQQASDLQKIINKFSSWKKETFLMNASQFEPSKLNASFGAPSFLPFFDNLKTNFNELEKQLNELLVLAKQEAYQANQKVETLLGDVKALLTVPFSVLLDGFPKMIRDLSKDLGKEVGFTIEGDSIEIDRRILEELKNPLTHLLRNSIDYGVEYPEERLKKNKNRKGSIVVKIEQIENNKVAMWVSDDGPGLNLKKLKELYLEKEEQKGNPQPEEITESELANFIFQSGVSTSEIVSDISGRGLGMAIVQESIEQLGGSIEVETHKDKGTTFKMVLPLSIVTFRGVILETSGRIFIVPTFKVQRILQFEKDQIKTIKNKATFQENGEYIPLYNLAETLEIPKSNAEKTKVTVIVFSVKGQKTGFIIDGVLGEQEVLVKNFNKQLTRVRNILGATVLGANQVVPVLNVADLYLSAANKEGSFDANTGKSDKKQEEQKSVLIVEDSITSRTLLRNIVESAGYKTEIAVDGVDGFTKCKTGNFDLVISDVEMPRMNGFELTEKIKTDSILAKTPVILVTSLSKREHREKGVEVGANAYIIKSSFDQGNLIDAIERLIGIN